MNTIRHIDDIIEEKSLLKHQFYQMWSEGKLSQDMLAGYSKEYYQLVKAVPLFMKTILSQTAKTGMLEVNMQEEYEHIPLWEDFAMGLGVSKDELRSCDGLEETRQAIDALHGLMDEYYNGAAAMYALEKEIPDISRTKMDGLDRFYGVHDKDTVEYFVQHVEADVRHAAEWRTVIESTQTSHDAMIRSAHTSMDAQNLLLDGCYNTYCDNN